MNLPQDDKIKMMMAVKCRSTGIKDCRGKMIYEGDVVRWPDCPEELLVVKFVGDGGDMNWAVDYKNGDPANWLCSLCEIVEFNYTVRGES